MSKKKKSTLRGLVTMLGIILCIILAVIIISFCILLYWSPGKAEPFYDAQGNILSNSVSEIVRMDIGGVEQGMIIRGENDQNPVLLFLHGGPGNPEYVLAKNYPTGLEEKFIVCWWDQRGSGMSYDASIPSEAMTLEQMVEDTAEVTNYLSERFQQDKIYIMGHSWGSFLGVNTVSQYPELYEAYIGIGQISNQLKSEQEGYDYMLTTMQTDGQKDYIKKLSAYSVEGPDDLTPEYLMLRSEILGKLGNGVFHAPQNQFRDILLPIFQAREYTLKDKYGYAMGALFCLKQPLNRSQFTVDLTKTALEFEIPVYIFHGVYDRQVSYELSKEYYDSINAPEKQFYSFENSAHSPFMEEPEAFIDIIIKDILAKHTD